MVVIMQDTQPQNSSLFPKIFRFITEKGIHIVIILTSFVVIAAIAIQGIALQKTMRQKDLAKAERLRLTKELAYWQDIVRQYSNYRDAYFRIATLQYQLGDMVQAKKSLEKVVALDPNFGDAKVLGAKIFAK